VFGWFFVGEPDIEIYFGDKVEAPKPGSAAVWFDKLYPNDEWDLKKAKDIANDIRRQDPKGPGYTSVRRELRRRRELNPKTPKRQNRQNRRWR
jgi:hypothetical protein